MKCRKVKELVFDHSIGPGEKNLIPEGYCGNVVVKGNLDYGDMSFLLGNKIVIEGNLVVYGNINVDTISVNGNVICIGNISSVCLEVSQNLFCIEYSAERVVVPGKIYKLTCLS